LSKRNLQSTNSVKTIKSTNIFYEINLQSDTFCFCQKPIQTVLGYILFSQRLPKMHQVATNKTMLMVYPMGKSTRTLSSHQWQQPPPSTPPTKLIVVQCQKALISLSFPSRLLQIENLLKSH
jgi:hypothetical protein